MGRMSEPRLPLLEEEYYELLSFFMSTAFLLCHGEQDEEFYPAMRMVDAAKRLTRAIIASGGFEGDEWPRQFVEECNQGLSLLGSDEEAFVAFVGESTRSMARELKRRAKTK
jgi:hypothetical protein